MSNSELQSNEVAIEIKDLKKYFRDSNKQVKAVDGISLKIKKHECFGFLGPNGAGKTTTINMLCGLLEPTGGTAIINGYDIRKNMNKIKEKIGVCPQEPAVFKFLNARENLELFGNLYGLPIEIIKERAGFLLDLAGLSEVGKRKTKGFSGGMIRRLNLVVSLINNPNIVFLDEPTVGMDAQNRRKTWNFIADLKKQDKTIILTTHYIEEAEKLSDRVGIIDQGKIIALAPPQELMDEQNAENLEEVFIKITGRKIREEV